MTLLCVKLIVIVLLKAINLFLYIKLEMKQSRFLMKKVLKSNRRNSLSRLR